MSPRVTVVMPVYNGERYIAQAIASVLASRFTDFELLVADDGSSDGSVTAAAAAAAGDPRVRILTLPHRGVAATRNAALREARGEFIANLDADDVMFPDRLTRQVAFLDRHPACVAVGGRSVIVSADGRPLRMFGRYFSHEAIDASLLAGNGGALGSNAAMFRRQAALDLGGYDDRLQSTGEDHDLWLRLAEVGRLASLPDVLVWYRIHGENVSVGEGSRERRLPITLDTLSRAFERRGITDRQPAKLPAPPLSAGERWCDRALCRYFSGDRRGAAWRVLVAAALRPASPATGAALRTIFSAPPPATRPS